jgi:hypothetical protein
VLLCKLRSLTLLCCTTQPYTTQVLWLFGADHQVTEVGAMNIFFVLKKKDGSGTEVRHTELCAVWDARAWRVVCCLVVCRVD